MVDYVFNRAAVIPAYTDRNRASCELAELLRGLALLDADADEELPAFRSYCNPWDMKLVEESIKTWSMGEIIHSFYETDRDLASYYDSLAAMTPADNDFDDAAIERLLSIKLEMPCAGYEVAFEKACEASCDVAICVVSGGVLASLLRQDKWQFDQVAFQSGGNVYRIDHAATPEHAFNIQKRRIEKIRTELTARNFETRKKKAYPYLRFGLEVANQLSGLDGGLLPLLFSRFSELDECVPIWRNSEEFPPLAHEIVRETAATMNRYGLQRSFKDGSGNNRIFEEHMWVDKLHRIHLIRDMRKKTIEIGYVGRHLPTMSFPT